MTSVTKHEEMLLARIKELEAYADKCNTEMNALEDKLREAHAMIATLSHAARVTHRWEQAEIDKVKAKVREALK